MNRVRRLTLFTATVLGSLLASALFTSGTPAGAALPQPAPASATGAPPKPGTAARQADSVINVSVGPEKAGADAAPAQAASADSDRVYKPSFLPKEIVLAPDEQEAIRREASRQVQTFHEAHRLQNESSATMYAEQAKYWVAKAQYDRWALSHNRATFERHSLYSRLIFFMVLFIVFSGLALTWYQFMRDSSDASRFISHALRQKGNAPVSDSQVAMLNLLKAQGEAEFGKDGVKLKTRVVGLMTLLLSMGFFYLYLHYVYPVTIKEPTSAEALGKKQSSDK